VVNFIMNKAEIIQTIRDIGIIPVVRASSPEEAVQVVEAIMAGGLPVLEITMTVPGAVRVIKELVKRFDDAIVGAGRCSMLKLRAHVSMQGPIHRQSRAQSGHDCLLSRTRRGSYARRADAN